MKPLLGVVGAGLMLSACADRVVRPDPALPAPKAAAQQAAAGANARSTGYAAGPDLTTMPIDAAGAGRALVAFRASCPALLRRTDLSGLTVAADWQPVCEAAMARADADAPGFFRAWFETAQVGDGSAFATGYYEPEIAGSRTASAGYAVPIYGRPDDLVEVDLGKFSDALKGKTISGRVEGKALLPYPDRGAIEDGALAGRNLEIAWAADPIEVFFLQVQGSGRLKLPDGSVMRIGYAGQNGRSYTGIGKLMRERGLIGPGQLSMQGIMAWLRAHPDEGRAIMRENKSFVFFRALTGEGPVGAMNVAVTPRVTVAADPAFVPLGAPVLLNVEQGASGLWVAQDTGGAIKGANRFDTFWGAGDTARTTAGGMSAKGTALVLLPKGTLARLKAEDGAAAKP